MGIYKVEPTNEIETREWFIAHLDNFEYDVIKSQTGFPDYTLQDSRGKQYLVEVEYLSENFIAHNHDPAGCDFVLCWIHNHQLDKPVLELSTAIFHDSDALPTVKLPYQRKLKRDKDQVKHLEVLSVIGNLQDECTAFMRAVEADLRINSEWSRKVATERVNLIRATNELKQALLKQRVDVGNIRPYDMLELVNNAYLES